MTNIQTLAKRLVKIIYHLYTQKCLSIDFIWNNKEKTMKIHLYVWFNKPNWLCRFVCVCVSMEGKWTSGKSHRLFKPSYYWKWKVNYERISLYKVLCHKQNDYLDKGPSFVLCSTSNASISNNVGNIQPHSVDWCGQLMVTNTVW